MKIYFSNKPSDLIHEIYLLNPSTFYINGTAYNFINCLLIFHIYNGKFITGYDQNGKRNFSLKVVSDTSYITMDYNVSPIKYIISF